MICQVRYVRQVQASDGTWPNNHIWRTYLQRHCVSNSAAVTLAAGMYMLYIPNRRLSGVI